jgi:hypothetical protein
VATLARPYFPRRPHETVLYGLVKEHWRDFFEHAREAYEAPLPKYVEDEFRGYLRCGDFARGFVQCRCTSCGHDLLIAFSCKQRGLCPSCSGRRMAGGAAFLVDRILPAAPVRQYVLAFPWELSRLAATRPEVLAHLCRIFWETLRRRYRRWAKDEGRAHAETGAVTGVQRFGSSLNVHVHFHVLVLDGVYAEEEGVLVFHPAPRPAREELEAMLERIHARVMKWLARRGYLRPDEDAPDATLSPAEALAAAGTQPGRLVTMREDGETDGETDGEAAPPARAEGDAVSFERFNLHASVTLSAHDDVGRERLCRYLLRPAFSLARIRVRKDGCVSYRVKKLGRRRATHRVMTPVEFLARLASLIPPPRFPLLRLHGVLAARHAWRARVVPRPPAPLPRSEPCARTPATDTPSRDAPPRDEPEPARGDGRAAFAVKDVDAKDTNALCAGAAERAGPNVLSVAHWNRLLGGELYAPHSRVDWALLLRRTFDCDLRVCARCGGRLSVRAVVTDPSSVEKILRALERSRDPPAAA